MKKYIVEFIGTFFLVLTIGLAAVYPPGSGALAPVAIGGILTAMVFMGGHISGAHYNPAVTIGAFVSGVFNKKDILPYLASQLLAGVFASYSAAYISGGNILLPASLEVGPSLLAEFLFTFALVTVILNVAKAKGTSGNSFYGLAIGITVMAGAFAVGPVSGGAFNPAVAVSISIMGVAAWGNLWIYLVANVLGGVLAGYIFKNVTPADS